MIINFHIMIRIKKEEAKEQKNDTEICQSL